jgi:UDP-N-acetylmuramate--alanine ligase
LPLALNPRQPVHFIGVGGIGMSALALILAERGFSVSGSDPRDGPVLSHLSARGVRVFRTQEAGTVQAIGEASDRRPVVVCSTAIPASNPELAAARRCGWEVWHRSDLLAALIREQPSLAVAGSHGKTTTSTLLTELLLAAGQDPTAVIGGIVPSLGRNGRNGRGRLLVAEADESDGSLVKFAPSLGVLTNLELDHTDHYPDLASLIATVRQFSLGCDRTLANHDCPVLRQHFQADAWWSVQEAEGVRFAALPLALEGDRTRAAFHEDGRLVGHFDLPLPGRHNLSNATAALAACRMEGIPFEDLRVGLEGLRPPGRRFDYRGAWQGRLVVDDYAHHPSEVAATLAMARLMVDSGRSPLPAPPRRLVAVFQPHRYSRTDEFLDQFARALAAADAVMLAPLYAAGEAPIPGVSSEALARAIRRHRPGLPMTVARSLDELADRVAGESLPGDLLLAMGAGDINGLWGRLEGRAALSHPGDHPPVAA